MASIDGLARKFDIRKSCIEADNKNHEFEVLDARSLSARTAKTSAASWGSGGLSGSQHRSYRRNNHGTGT